MCGILKYYHQTPDGVLHELTPAQWLFLSTDMAILPERYEGHRLLEKGLDKWEEFFLSEDEQEDDGIL